MALTADIAGTRHAVSDPSTAVPPEATEPGQATEPRQATEARQASQPGAARVRAMVDEHFSFVWRYVRGLGVAEAHVDDATQQVFIVAAQKVDMITAGAERSFLVGTARGVAANARRTSARRREVSDDGVMDAHADAKATPEEHLASQQGLAILDDFLGQLPDELREVFILFELEGMTMAAMAEALHLPPGTVASRLRRAREEFQEMAKRFQAAQKGAPPASGPRKGRPS